jgi:NSS family neurotransmitter:Na+ symporter
MKKETAPHLRGHWHTRMGFLLAAIGSAVGLGNIWRFPYICYKNGGGAFLIPYFIALFMVGIPLMILELGLGHRFQASAPLACRMANKRWEMLGWWPIVFVMFGIMLYYCVVIAWCVNYFVLSFDLGWGQNTAAFFHQTFLGLTSGPFDIGDLRISIAYATIAVWGVTWFIVYRGIGKGIELANKIFMPVLFVLMIALVAWSATLPGAGEGIRALLTPDTSRLLDPQAWSDAFSQIFFSLSLGFGIMITYASYLPRKAHITNNGIITACANCGFEIFAGFAVFATLGYMAHMQHVAVSDVVAGGPGLAFVAYPKAINLLPFGNRAFGIIFFLALIFAGLSSGISIIEAFSAGLVDKFGHSRKWAVSIICAIGAVGSLIFANGAGLYWLDIVDHFINNYGLLVVGILEAILIGWIFGAKRFADGVNKNPGFKIGRIWRVSIQYVTPIVLVAIVGTEAVRNVLTPYGGYSWISLLSIGVGWFVMTIAVAYVVTKRRWKHRKHEVEDAEGPVVAEVRADEERPQGEL